MKQKAPRESNIELLRILAAMGVIILHYNNANIGGAMAAAPLYSANSVYLYVIESICICAVDLFMLISGFFSANRTSVPVRRVVRMLIQISIIKAIFTFVFANIDLVVLTEQSYFRSFWPVNHFLILYCTVTLLSPFLNLLIREMRRTSVICLCLVLLLLFSVWPYIADRLEVPGLISLNSGSTISSVGSGAGYTIVNYVMMYLIGASIRRLGIRLKKRFTFPLLILIWGLIFLNGYLHHIDFKGLGPEYSYCSPLVIASAVFLFLLFREIPLGRRRIINELAGGSLVVYLTHKFIIERITEEITDVTVNGTTGALALHQLKYCLLLYLLGYAVHRAYWLLTWPVYRLTDRSGKGLIISAVKEENGNSREALMQSSTDSKKAGGTSAVHADTKKSAHSGGSRGRTLLTKVLPPAVVLAVCFLAMRFLPLQMMLLNEHIVGEAAEEETAAEEEETDLFHKYLDYGRLKLWSIAGHEKDSFHRNYAINAAEEIDTDGLHMGINSDGSVTFNGTYRGKKDLWLKLSTVSYRLPKGTYYFYDEGFTASHDLCKLRFGEGKSTENGLRIETLIRDEKPGRFTVATNDYLNYYIGFRVKPGFTADNETVRFMIYRDWSYGKKDIPDTLEYEPCPVLHYTGDDEVTKYAEFHMEKEEFQALTKKERNRFFNSMRDQYSRIYDWCTLDFRDGTGIQYVNGDPDTGRYGSLDAAKQVVNQTAKVEYHWFNYDLLTPEGQSAGLF